MTLRIEDYAIIGDCKTAALVGRDGSIDWLCWPRFDSAACFAALLGTPDNGRWLLAPNDPALVVRRSYLPGTLILETEFQTETGCAAIVDFMHPLDGAADLVRIVVGRSGQLMFRTELVVRFDYGVPSMRLPARCVSFCVPRPRCTAKISKQSVSLLLMPASPFPSSFLTGPQSKADRRRSIPLRRSSGRKPSGVNGATGVHRLGLGRTRSSGRSSR